MTRRGFVGVGGVRLGAVVAGVVAVAVVAAGQGSPAMASPSAVVAGLGSGIGPVSDPPVQGTVVGPVAVLGVGSMPAYVPRPVVWPEAGAGSVVPGLVGRLVKAPGTVVSLAARSAPRVGQVWRVDAAGRDVAQRLGGDGLAFTVSQTGLDPLVGADEPQVSVDVSGFSDAFGGGYASRLRLVEVPLCAWAAARAGADPGPGCARAPRVLPTVVDPVTRVLTADVAVLPAGAAAAAAAEVVAPLPGPVGGAAPAGVSGSLSGRAPFKPVGPSTGGVTDTGSGAQPAPMTSAYVVSSGTSGQEGDYAATPLTAAGSWSVDAASGSFQYSYPFPTVAAVTGPVPQLGVSYSSASVDGMTSGDNSQASQVGSGWDLGVPYIERQFRPCSTDGHAGMGDLCWTGDQYRIVMNGHSERLVRDTTTSVSGGKVFRLRSDPGWRVELYSNPGNAHNPDNDGEYWNVYTPDGTKYVFGRGYVQTAGYSTPRETNATWTVPVFGDDAGEPCHQSTLAASWCQQAWRWNLELQLDTHSNQVAYFYQEESNKYRRNNTTDTSYDRGGFLSAIEYDGRFGYPGEAPRARIDLVNEPRCTQRMYGDPTPSGTCASFGAGNESSYPDVPLDLLCTSSCTQTSPSFFSHYLLRSVTAQRSSGSGSWLNVERASLGYQLPDPTDGTTPSLWLSKIERTGLVGGSVSMPVLDVGSVLLANRVDYNTSAGVAPLKKYRAATIIDELGARTEVSYGHGPGGVCTAALVSQANWQWDTNNHECFPRWWSPAGSAPGFGVFHKYVVTQVTRVNTFPAGTSGQITGSPQERTTYTYDGVGGWTKPDDPTADPSTVSYSEWRGYGTVSTQSMTDAGFRGGSSGVIRKSSDLYYRGLDGKPMGDGSSKSYDVTTSQNVTTPDTANLQGLVREHREFLYSGGAWSEEEATTHSWTTARPAIQAGPTPDAARDSYLMVESGVVERQSTGTGTRSISTSRAYTPFGLPVSDCVTASGAASRCTLTSYAGDAAAQALNKVSYPAVVNVRAGTATSLGKYLSSTFYYYDGATVTTGAPLTKGDATKVEVGEDTDTAGTIVTTRSTSTATFDGYGRQTSSTDPLQHTTSTSYPAVSAVPQVVTVTDALQHTTSTTFERYRLQPVATTDANSQTTTSTYDELGRLETVARPGDTDAAPTMKFVYNVYTDQPHRVATATLQPGTSRAWNWSYTYLDSFGRARQTQTVAPTSPYNGQDVAQLVATRYDEAGQVEGQTTPVAALGTAGHGMIALNLNQVRETRTAYDTMGRPGTVGYYASDTRLWKTSTTYAGYASATTTPPAGGVAVTETTDGLGRTTARTEGSGATTATTQYGYDAADRVTSITDPDAKVSSRSYDLQGHVVTSSDPDAGTSTISYDDAGQPTLSTRSDATATQTSYDQVGRVTKVEGRTSPTAAWQTLTESTYDTATLGIGYPASSTTHSALGDLTTAVTGYTTWGQPAGASTTVPAGFGGLAAAKTYTSTIGYDPSGRPTTVSYPAAGGLPAETVTTGYSDLGLLTTFTGSQPYLSATTYNGVSQVTSRTLAATPAPITRTYTWESATARLTGVTTTLGSSTAQNDTLTWNDAGSLTQQVDTLTGTRTCHTYDALNRLTHSWTTAATGCTDTDTTTAAGPAGYNTSWAYTQAGNTTSVRRGPTTTTYGYGDPNHPHAVTTAGTTSYAYDAQGRQTTRTPATGSPTTRAWDLPGNLKSATTASATTTFVHTGDGTRLARVTPDGTATVYAAGQEVDLKNGAETTTRRYYSAGADVVAIRTPTKLTWQANDRQNSADLQVTNGTTTIDRAYYDPYGNPRTGGATLATDKGWLGKTTDPTTGLTHLGARYYDTILGRFLSPDPLNVQQSTQTPNAYSYGTNNPVSMSDPSGLRPLGTVDEGCINCKKSYTKSGKSEWTFGNENVKVDAWTHNVSYDTSNGQGYASVFGKYYSGTKYTGAGSHWTEQPYVEPPETWVSKTIMFAVYMSPEAGILSAIDGINSIRRGDAGEGAINLATSLPLGRIFRGAKAAERGVEAAESGPELTSGLERTGSALRKSDAFHRSVSWVVDNPDAQHFAITGGDGVGRELYQLPGEVNGKSGVFEWLIDRSGANPVINHQRFIPGGSVTGYPNQVVP